MYEGEVRRGGGRRGIIVSLISCQSHAWHRIKCAQPKTGKSSKSPTTHTIWNGGWYQRQVPNHRVTTTNNKTMVSSILLFEWNGFHSPLDWSWYKVQLIEGRRKAGQYEWQNSIISRSPSHPEPSCLVLYSARCQWVWWVRQWRGDSDPQNLPLPAPWLLDIVPTPGSAETERADTAFMARLRKLCPLESLCLRFKLKPALVVADQRPAADGWLVPSGHIVTIFCAIVDPQLPFVNVLFPGFLTSPYHPSWSFSPGSKSETVPGSSNSNCPWPPPDSIQINYL